MNNCQKWTKFDVKSPKFYFRWFDWHPVGSNGYSSYQKTTVGIKILDFTPFFDSKRAIFWSFWGHIMHIHGQLIKMDKIWRKIAKFLFPLVRLAIGWLKGLLHVPRDGCWHQNFGSYSIFWLKKRHFWVILGSHYTHTWTIIAKNGQILT